MKTFWKKKVLDMYNILVAFEAIGLKHLHLVFLVPGVKVFMVLLRLLQLFEVSGFHHLQLQLPDGLLLDPISHLVDLELLL